MRREDIDYREYDPARFVQDHPDDPTVQEARQRAEDLASNLRKAELTGTPEEQRRDVEQRFDDLQGQEWDRRQHRDQLEQKDELYRYRDEKTDAIYERAHDRLAQARSPEGEIAAWEGTKQEVDRARESAPNDPEFKERQAQLENFQAVRSEAASEEIHQVQQAFLKERGLDQALERAAEAPVREEPEGASRNAQHLPEDVMEKATEGRPSTEQEERLARAREAYAKAGAPPEPTEDRSEDQERGRSR